MTKNAFWLSLLGLGFAVSGCSCLHGGDNQRPVSTSAMPPPIQVPTAQECQTNVNDCEIRVKIDPSQSPCAVVVNYQITWVHAAKDVRLVWILDAPRDYRFVYVRFKDSVRAYQELNGSRIPTLSSSQFDPVKVTPRRAETIDHNTVNGLWPYEIEVSNGASTCKVDPPVVNG